MLSLYHDRNLPGLYPEAGRKLLDVQYVTYTTAMPHAANLKVMPVIYSSQGVQLSDLEEEREYTGW